MAYTNRTFTWDFDALKRFYEKYVKYDNVFDISEYNKSEGVLAVYSSLENALDAVPAGKRKAGMSVKFILRNNIGTTEDPVYKDEYVQYVLTSTSWSTDSKDWAVITSVCHTDNPEFLAVQIDANGRIVEATMPDGTKLLPAGFNIQGAVVKVEENPEWLKVELDSAGRIVSGISRDGEAIYGGINISEMKRELDLDTLEVGIDEEGIIYTIENSNSTITMEIDDDWNVYEVKDTRQEAEIVMEDNAVYIEQTLNSN